MLRRQGARHRSCSWKNGKVRQVSNAQQRHDVLGSLHSNAVQGLPLSFELFLIGLCDLLRSDGSVSYCLCIIEQRVGLVHLLNSQTTGQSGLHERRHMSCAGWDVPRARDGGLGPGMMRRCPLGMSFLLRAGIKNRKCVHIVCRYAWLLG